MRAFRQVGGVMHAVDANAWAGLAVSVSRLVRMHARVNGVWPQQLLVFVEEAEAAARAVERGVPSTEAAEPVSATLVEVDVRTAATRLGCSPRWVTALCVNHKIRARKVGRVWLVDAADIDRQKPREEPG